MSVITALNTFTQMAACRVAATSNQVGTLFAPTTTGVGTTFTYTSTGALVIDSITLNVSDRVLLVGQSATLQNGIWVVINAGSSTAQAVLQRSGDMQTIEQLKAGQYIPIGAGTAGSGAIYMLIEPLPGAINVNAINYSNGNTAALGLASLKGVTDNAQPNVVSIVDAAVAVGNLASFADTAGTLQDGGAKSNVVSLNAAAPSTTRSLAGKIQNTVATQTSGNIVGVRGEVDVVSASGGFLYGAQGKIIPTGTLSGSVWAAGVFGQFDLSAATITSGQTAAIWGDYGTTATAGTYAGARLFAGTNTTAAILNAQIYLYGAATNLLELDDNNGLSGPTYFVAAGTGSGSAGNTTHCAADKALKITMNGVDYWLPLFNTNS